MNKKISIIIPILIILISNIIVNAVEPEGGGGEDCDSNIDCDECTGNSYICKGYHICSVYGTCLYACDNDGRDCGQCKECSQGDCEYICSYYTQFCCNDKCYYNSDKNCGECKHWVGSPSCKCINSLSGTPCKINEEYGKEQVCDPGRCKTVDGITYWCDYPDKVSCDYYCSNGNCKSCILPSCSGNEVCGSNCKDNDNCCPTGCEGKDSDCACGDDSCKSSDGENCETCYWDCACDTNTGEVCLPNEPNTDLKGCCINACQGTGGYSTEYICCAEGKTCETFINGEPYCGEAQTDCSDSGGECLLKSTCENNCLWGYTWGTSAQCDAISSNYGCCKCLGCEISYYPDPACDCNGHCDLPQEFGGHCLDCGSIECGNNACEPGESCNTCPQDCNCSIAGYKECPGIGEVPKETCEEDDVLKRWICIENDCLCGDNTDCSEAFTICRWNYDCCPDNCPDDWSCYLDQFYATTCYGGSCIPCYRKYTEGGETITDTICSPDNPPIPIYSTECEEGLTCDCTTWVNNGCNGPFCAYNEYYYSRTCTGSDCDPSKYPETNCVFSCDCEPNCINSDTCCPAGCDYTNDNDCPPECIPNNPEVCGGEGKQSGMYCPGEGEYSWTCTKTESGTLSITIETTGTIEIEIKDPCGNVATAEHQTESTCDQVGDWNITLTPGQIQTELPYNITANWAIAGECSEGYDCFNTQDDCISNCDPLGYDGYVHNCNLTRPNEEYCCKCLTTTTLPTCECDFKVWVEGPALFTIGSKIPVKLFVQNLCQPTDTYNIEIEMIESPIASVELDYDQIEDVSPREIRVTYPRILILESHYYGEINFTVTSQECGITKKDTLIITDTTLPLSLPEFSFIGLLVMMSLAGFIFV